MPSITQDGKPKVLVTGATGFIGGYLVRTLRQAGYPVRVLVRNEARTPAAPGVELYVGDLLRPDSLVGIEQGVEVVVHCASILGKWGTPNSLLHDVNVQGSINLLARFEGIALSRYVHLSAGGVTGPVRQGFVDETYVCKPATPYERTKLLAEQQVLKLSRQMGVPATVVRPTFTYGPGDPHKIGLFLAVKKGRYAFIGDGESVNHPVFVQDLVSGIRLVFDKGRAGEVYIIGGERPVSKRELVDTIADALGVKRPGIRVPRWLAVIAAWKLEVLGRLLRFEPILTRSRVMMMADNFGYSIAKARDELGYAPQTDLREGIAKTVRSYREAGLL